MVVPDDGYLSGAHALLKKHNALLIADEVGQGWGWVDRRAVKWLNHGTSGAAQSGVTGRGWELGAVKGGGASQQTLTCAAHQSGSYVTARQHITPLPCLIT